MAAVKGKTNWFAVWISAAAVVAIVAVGALVVVSNNIASDPGEAPAASNVDQTTGAISYGTGSQTVDTYIDFMCPYCNQFEQTEGKTILGLVDSGEITLNVFPVSILDRLSQGTEYSSRAASAMYAVAAADPDNSYAFLQALYANQPAENSAGLSDEEIVQIAKDAGVNVTSELETAITSHQYIQFAKSRELPEGATGTPTLVVNDELVSVTFDPQVDIVARLS